MRVVHTLVSAYQYFILLYFAALNVAYASFAYLGLRNVVIYSRGLSRLALKDLLEQEIYKPVSILVPAHNEEKSIVASVRSFVDLHYPEFEVIVVSDGSTDGTIDRLVDAFALVEEPRIYRRTLPTQPVQRIFRSLRHPNLIVAEKERGGKSDALNAALNLARHPLVSAVDSDSLLDAEAILRASRLFVEDETVVAVGGAIRPLNGATVEDGLIKELRMPRSWMERIQILEYARAFFIGRAGWSHFDALLIISGAFGLFRRSAVTEIGGYWTETVCEDMEIVMRLKKHYRREGKPCRIVFAPDPVCWTEVPSDFASLLRQRRRWQRGLRTNLWAHRDMLLNPRYGRLGLLALPYFWLFEALAPVVEVSGYLMLPLGMILHELYPNFALLFLALTLLFGMLQSQVAVGVEALLLARYPRFSDRVILLLTPFVEFFGYRQLITLIRFRATFERVGRGKEWGEIRRTGIPVWRGSEHPVEAGAGSNAAQAVSVPTPTHDSYSGTGRKSIPPGRWLSWEADSRGPSQRYG